MRSAAPVTQKHLSKPEDLMLQNATPLRESAPGPPKINIVLRLPRKMHLCRSSSNAPRLPSFLEMRQNPHGLLTFDKVHNPLRLPRETTSERPKCSVPLSFLHFWLRNVLRATTTCTFSTSQLPKVVRRWGVLYILTSKCASRHNFDILTSKSGRNMVCFDRGSISFCDTVQEF